MGKKRAERRLEERLFEEAIAEVGLVTQPTSPPAINCKFSLLFVASISLVGSDSNAFLTYIFLEIFSFA